MKTLHICLLACLSAGQSFAADNPGGWQPATSAHKPTAPTAIAPAITAPEPIEEHTEHQEPQAKSPLPAPSAALSYAQDQATPLTGEEIKQLSRSADNASRGRAYQPTVAVPRISSLTVNLSPGSSIPILRTAMNQSSSVTFSDSTGAPWKLGAPPYNSNSAGFQVEYIAGSAIMTVQAMRRYDTGNVTVYLEGLSVPVVVNLASGEPDDKSTSQIMDSRLDLRIPMRGPDAKAMAQPETKIGLYNTVLQSFLDGIPPKDAKRLKTNGNVAETTVWQLGDDLYIRSRSEIRDEFEETQSSIDGTYLWKLPLTPYVSFSVMGRTESLTIHLE
ncbi:MULTISPECIES: DotH/IcmK family type IV secretion protein [Yersinia]|uniref:TraN protein n=2 Tax=Yersinia TaxID=629 RepID=B7UEZ5_YERPU|nr:MULTISPECIES: DotH/IcmK family type IV secretion protein [Yersinia]MBO1551382.1 conjugal transfer protein TraN [Yersinia pseudotuberculosis]MBO1562458.1 conjugal transfer protein TraN [Yersinia pseudotuberculosis]MBO1571435.1 conjugal transfer protein TraN [Yersinia pseudotuberculosis]MBO1586387.1 conjugal transfer protein TraN [Yersinia pseudotuberculosis]MBO1631787.1 conjugal transfer protein TraN [Yersinia pseudotuberculosis]